MIDLQFSILSFKDQLPFNHKSKRIPCAKGNLFV